MGQVLSAENSALSVSNRTLLALYLVIPLSVITVLFDGLWGGFQLRDEILPSNPGALLWWAIIFNFPHIVSSFITLVDDEYIPYYKQRFSRALLYIVAGVLTVNYLLPLLAPAIVSNVAYALFFVFFSAYTMYHVLSQQFGIGMMMMGVRPAKQYEWWRYLSTVAASLMYLMAFAKPNLQSAELWGENLYLLTQWLAGVFVVLASFVGIHLLRQGTKFIGQLYVAMNILMLFVVWFLAANEYSFFVILIPRFVHDITAFMIYSVHDQNRNREVAHNYIYKYLRFLPLSPLLLCPILAILVANALECSAYMLDFSLGFDPSVNSDCFMRELYVPQVTEPLPDPMRIGMQILFISGLFHYYIESFVWKREAIHRHSLSFK